MAFFALLIGRVVRFAVRLVRPGGGSALPGLVVSKIAPNLVYKALGRFQSGVVIVTGTAGKSTTTKMAVAIIRAHGIETFTNPSTANIEQGFFSTMVKSGTITGKLPGRIAVLEMDEGHAAAFVKKVRPRITALLNVFDDQVDRFVDPELVAGKLIKVAEATTEVVISNSDDPNLNDLNYIAAKTTYFGLGNDLPSLPYAKTSKPKVKRPNPSYEATGLSERNVVIQTPFGQSSFELPSRGAHFAQDATAALAVAAAVLEEEFSLDVATEVLNSIPPVFSRGEILEINGNKVEFILIQNPISFQLNLDNLPDEVGPIMLAIGRDVHDPSWLWTVDLKRLSIVHTVSGFNYADAALLLKYKGIQITHTEPEYFKAIDEFMQLEWNGPGVKTVLYSADAMRRLRRYLGFTDPEAVERV
ncbi:MAG: MurT ligase domain-containing protein [Rhodoluna sp.]